MSGIAFPLYLRRMGWSISDIATFSFFSGLPWVFKIVYGAFSDAVPILGYRRKAYLIFASLLSVMTWIALSFFPQNTISIYFLAIASNLGFAVTDVVTDALIVEHSAEATSQIYQSLAWGFRSVGAVLGGALGGWMAQKLPYSWIFGFTSLLPCMTLVVGFFIDEARLRDRGEVRGLVAPIKESLSVLFRGDLRWYLGFLLTGTFGASFSTPLFFYLKDQLAFSESFLGVLSSLAWLGAIMGCFIYGRFLKNMHIKKALFWAVALNVINTLSTLWIFNSTSAMLLSLLGGIMAYLSLLPTMAAAAVLARQKGVEGTLFALIMSVHNLGQILSTLMGGRFFDIMGLVPLIFLSTSVAMIGFFFVNRLRYLRA